MSSDSTDARYFRERVAELRKAKGLTQAKLAELIGKDNSYIGRIETGEIDTPPLDTLSEIAGYLEVPIGEFFNFQGKGDSANNLREKIQKLIATDDVIMLRKYYRLLLIVAEK